MSNGARSASARGGAPYRFLRELGSRTQPTHAALRAPSELVVVQRFTQAKRDAIAGVTAVSAEGMALLLRDARALSTGWHPNLARVKHVDFASGELTFATELVDGATLEDLAASAKAGSDDAAALLPASVIVRVLLDVLAGLAALHALRDHRQAALGLFHGEVCPANVVVGRDGIARLVDVLRHRPVRITSRSPAVGYAAPEALEFDGANDPRADLYAVGVMLWEALAGRRLYDERDPSRVLARQREGELQPPRGDASDPLAVVAMRALAFDANMRFATATEMASELRAAAGTKLASGAIVASRVADLAGDRIRERRATLDPALSGTRKRASDADIAEAHAARITRPDSDAVVAAAIEGELEDDDDFDDDDLPGPRGSSPVIDEAAMARELASAPATPREPPRALRPTAPHVNANAFPAKQIVTERMLPRPQAPLTPSTYVAPVPVRAAPAPFLLVAVAAALAVIAVVAAAVIVQRATRTSATQAEPPLTPVPMPEVTASSSSSPGERPTTKKR